jgi:transposase
MDIALDITDDTGLARALSYIKRLERENELLREALRLERAHTFGASSERGLLHGQGILFNEAELYARADVAEPSVIEVVRVKKAKRKGKRELDLSSLPVRRIDYELTEDECVCPECSGPLHEMSTEVRREVEYIPARAVVVEHATHIYACRKCQKDSEHTPIIRANSPRPLFSGSLASASLMSHVICDKYLYHLPLYRQEAAFKADGLHLTRQTLSNWVVKVSEDWLYAIYARMRERLVGLSVIHADETTLEVLREEGRAAKDKSYMWLYRTSGCETRPIVIYEYKPSRSHECPKAFLKDFTGYVHADGYAAYHRLPDNITVVGCWAHARRKFADALKAAPEDVREGSLASCGLAFIDKLFALERTFAELTPPERYRLRLEKSKPVADGLYEWVASSGVVPKSLVGKAITYLSEQHDYLYRVFEDGRLELSNNRAERSIKPFVIGRKNWLFSNTPSGADASAVIFSIIETAKENGLNVYNYLEYLLGKLPNSTTRDIDNLMPWSDSLPSTVKVPVAYTP